MYKKYVKFNKLHCPSRFYFRGGGLQALEAVLNNIRV
jgi:hypothetical protein